MQNHCKRRIASPVMRGDQFQRRPLGMNEMVFILLSAILLASVFTYLTDWFRLTVVVLAIIWFTSPWRDVKSVFPAPGKAVSAHPYPLTSPITLSNRFINKRAVKWYTSRYGGEGIARLTYDRGARVDLLLPSKCGCYITLGYVDNRRMVSIVRVAVEWGAYMFVQVNITDAGVVLSRPSMDICTEYLDSATQVW